MVLFKLTLEPGIVMHAGKTVLSLFKMCQPEHFRDEYRTHYKALYKHPVYLLTNNSGCMPSVL